MHEVWTYFSLHHSEITGWLWTTVWLAGVPLVIGLVLALPIGWVASRYHWSYPPITSIAGLLYTIPSLVLFLVVPGIVGTQILSPVNVAVGLTAYTLALLVRTVADGLDSVSPATMAAASAMGYTSRQRLFAVQLPLAVPVIGAGLRVAAVSNVSLVSVGSVIGVLQLGQLFVIAFSQDAIAPAFIGLVMFIALALVFDLVILGIIRALTPWQRAGGEPMTTHGILASGANLPGFDRMFVWFNDPQNWWGPFGLATRIREHLIYTVIILIIAVAIALPLGLFVGHTGRGVVVVVGIANGLRAVPTLGMVILLYLWLSSKIKTTFEIPWVVDRGALASFVSVVVVLILLALPPILTNTYAGVQNVDPAARDAAKGMGMTGFQVVRKVELPCALPLIMSGIRSAALQVIATVTVAAYLPFLGGLGRFIKDGAAQIYELQAGYPAMLAAGLTVAVLAVIIDALFNLLQRSIVSPGLTGRVKRDKSEPREQSDDPTDATAEANLIGA